MKRIRIVMALVLILSVLFIVTIVSNGAPVLAQPNAQATSTPEPNAQATSTPEPNAQATSTPEPNAQATSTPEPNAQDQTYVTFLPGTSGPYRLVTLTLKADNKADMVTDPLGAEPPVTQVGTWQLSGGNVTLTLTGDGTRTYDKPVTLEFKQEAESLVATAFDKSIYGDRGLTLYLRDTVEAKIASAKRAYVTLDLAAGFPLDPFLVSVNGGGELDASILSDQCHGYINGNPSVSVNWSGQADLVRAFTYSDADPVLVVQTPDGKFLCGDDASALVLDSQVEIAQPSAGTYNIWVGSAQPKQLLPTILVVTARPDMNLGNFQLGDLVKRPPLPASGAATSNALQAQMITEAIARYKGTMGGPLGATLLTQQVSAAGDIAAFEIDLGGAFCNGFIADTPNYVFDVSSALEQFTVLFEGKQDATLLVVGPDGTVTCNDDSVQDTNANPGITIEKPKQGRYAVFVGRINQDAVVEGTLTVTTNAQAAPQVLSPSK